VPSFRHLSTKYLLRGSQCAFVPRIGISARLIGREQSTFAQNVCCHAEVVVLPCIPAITDAALRALICSQSLCTPRPAYSKRARYENRLSFFNAGGNNQLAASAFRAMLLRGWRPSAAIICFHGGGCLSRSPLAKLNQKPQQDAIPLPATPMSGCGDVLRQHRFKSSDSTDRRRTAFFMRRAHESYISPSSYHAPSRIFRRETGTIRSHLLEALWVWINSRILRASNSLNPDSLRRIALHRA